MPSILFHSTVGHHYTWRPSLARVEAALGLLQEDLEDLTELAEEMIPILQKDMEERFYKEVDPKGRPWKPLVRPAPDQVGILRLTETMFEAAISDDAWQADDGSVYFDAEVLPFYWSFHQLGTSHIPVRAFIGISQNAKAELAAWGVFESGVRDKVERAKDFATSDPFPTGVLREPGTGRFMSPGRMLPSGRILPPRDPSTGRWVPFSVTPRDPRTGRFISPSRVLPSGRILPRRDPRTGRFVSGR